MRRQVFAVIMLFVVLIFQGCQGPQGDSGPTGPQGPEGPTTPGIYYIRIFQNGVYSSAYTGQVQSSLFGNMSGPYYTSNTMPISVGQTNVGATYRALIKFDLSSLPGTKIIVDKAEIIIKTSSVHYGGGANNMTVHKLTKKWVMYEAGWDWASQGVSWGNDGGDYDANTITPQSGTIDILANSTITIELDPKTVQGWMENPATNYGLIIRGVDEYTTNNYAEIYPSGATDPANRPMLKVWYYTVE